MAVKQPHPHYGGTLLENLQVYQSILTMFYLPHGDKRQDSASASSSTSLIRGMRIDVYVCV